MQGPADLGPWLARAGRRLDVVAFALCAALFALFPRLDLAIQRWLHTPEAGFFWADHPLVQLLYTWTEVAAMGLLLSAVAAWVGGWWWGRRRRSDGAARLRRGGSFVVVMALVGPLLVVNGLLKEHWGRARPADIAAFGGTRIYTPPLEPAAQCDSNCAFVSGHASAGFSFMALGWVFRHPALMAFGTAFGSLAGLGRMAQGDHFLSDVVFSFWVVYFCCVAVAHRWFGTSRIRRGEQEGVKRWDRLTASA